MSKLLDKKICFIGGGAMAEALIRGLIHQQKVKPASVHVLDNGGIGRLEYLSGQYGITPVDNESEIPSAINTADLIVLAIKPKDAAIAVKQYRSSMHRGQLLISFVAGLSVATITQLVGFSLPIVRTMPNTSSSIGLGATGLSCNGEVDEAGKQLAIEFFEAIGMVSEVSEDKLDIVTGVSGSGPAYIYYVVESMIAGGIAGGLDELTAKQLTIQTVLGAAEMLRQTGEDPAELRRKVTSPNGTTEAALRLMAEQQVGPNITNAVLRAAERAAEMGEEIAKEILTNEGSH